MSQQSLHSPTLPTSSQQHLRIMLGCGSAFVEMNLIGSFIPSLGDGVRDLDMPKLVLHVCEYQRTYRSRRTTYSSTST